MGHMKEFLFLLNQAPKGPRMEIGVHAGASLVLIAKHPDITYGVDSFEGMAEPSEHDIVGGVNNYPAGRLAVPMARVEKLISSRTGGPVELIKGFVPEVLETLPEGPFAFVHLDIDHYLPTQAALEWLWPRMAEGGILLCDDWFEGQDFLAAKALNEKAEEVPPSGTQGRKIWWVFGPKKTKKSKAPKPSPSE